MKRDSWHYSLAKMGNNGKNLWDVSICEYTRKVIFGGILALFLAVLICVAVGWVGVALYEIIGAIFGFAELTSAAFFFIGLSVNLSGIATYHIAKDRWEYKSRELLKKENTSFVASAYKSYKEKICFKVNFED